MESLGFVPGKRYATLSSTGEMVAGSLLTLGLGGPIAPGLMIAIMLVAARTAHKDKGYFAQGGGYELAALYATAGVALAMAGPGRFSLDAALNADGARGRKTCLASPHRRRSSRCARVTRAHPARCAG